MIVGQYFFAAFSNCDHLLRLVFSARMMSENSANNQMMNEDRNIIKLRGLPWNSTNQDIMDFLKDCDILNGEKGVHLAISHRDGRPNGEAFVELATIGDVDKAFEHNKMVLGHRYIESKLNLRLLNRQLIKRFTF